VSHWRAWSLFISLFSAGCTCGAFDPATTRFACTTDDDCGAGFHCAAVSGAQECVRDGSSGGGGGATGGGGGGGAVSTGGGGGGAADDAGLDDAGLEDAGLDDAGTPDAGTPDAGMDAGTGGGGGSNPPTRLAFTTNPQTVTAGGCSAALTVQTRNAQNMLTPVSSATTVSWSASGTLLGLNFYSDSACATAASTSVIASGGSTATVYARGSTSGSGQVTASSPGFTAATQSLTVASPPQRLVFTSTPPASPILPGTCFAATVQAQSLIGAPVPVSTNATVSLVATQAGTVRFHSDSQCRTVITTTTIAAGQSSASFFVKVVSGGTGITATASFGMATQSFTGAELVHRGTCSLPGSSTSATCPVNPGQQSLNTTLLVYQATASANEPLQLEVRCRLSTVDTITCYRGASGNTLTIHWQTAEMVGLDVQRGIGSCGPSPLSRTVAADQSFVLSSMSGVGANFDGDDLASAVLRASGDAVDLSPTAPQACSAADYQVVTLPGITVLRGTAGGTQPAFAPGSRSQSVTGLAAASTNTVLLHQAGLSSTIANSTSMCHLFVRGEVATPTSLTFTRGADALSFNCSFVPLDTVSWERVDFGARANVQRFTTQLSSLRATQIITPVDMTRTLTFAGGQQAAGQATGETSQDTSGDDNIGSAIGRFELTANDSVDITRGRSQGTTSFTFYVVELEP
jgi:hypothetical protein